MTAVDVTFRGRTMRGRILRRRGSEIDLEIGGMSGRIMDALRFGPVPITVDGKPCSVHAISIVNLCAVLECCEEQKKTMKYTVRFDGSTDGVSVEATSVDLALHKAVEQCLAKHPDFAGLANVPSGASQTIGALVCDPVTGAKEFRQITIARRLTVETTRPTCYYVYCEDSFGVLHMDRVCAPNYIDAAVACGHQMGDLVTSRPVTVVAPDGSVYEIELEATYRAVVERRVSP